MNFAKTFWAALLAFVVANILFWIVLFLLIGGVAALMSDPVPTIKKNSVLVVDLSNGINDSPSTSPIASVGLGGIYFDNSNTIFEALSAIQRAAYDDNIKGMFINMSRGGSVNLSNIEEIRTAIGEFQSEGKFVVSYADSYSQLGYYLSSVADAVFLHPQGDIDWRGLSGSVMFYKGLMDKLGLEVDILRHGEYKSAVEPFMYDRMSPENRVQTETMLNTIWEAILEDVSLSRNIEPAVLSNYATELAIRSANHAAEYGMVDALLYEDQVMEVISRMIYRGETIWQAGNSVMGPGPTVLIESEDDPDNSGEASDDPVDRKKTRPETILLPDYIAAHGGQRSASKNKVALVYADGEIMDGEESDGIVGGNALAAKLAKARRDNNTKAVVLRVNSPGGSALASDVIWREMELLRMKKPLIVSMGSMAASGGYWISAPADVILANRSTLTGSIGVFGLHLDISRTLREKAGITVDVVRTNPSADLGSPYRRLSQHEREVIMYGIEDVYNTFLHHVAEGRNMSWQEVDRIGGGRVWSGVSALEIGLIDSFGGLTDALSLAADRAGVADNFRVWEVVDSPESLTAIIKQLGGIGARSAKDELGEAFMQYNYIKNLVEEQGVRARMPYTLEIE